MGLSHGYGSHTQRALLLLTVLVVLSFFMLASRQSAESFRNIEQRAYSRLSSLADDILDATDENHLAATARRRADHLHSRRGGEEHAQREHPSAAQEVHTVPEGENFPTTTQAESTQKKDSAHWLTPYGTDVEPLLIRHRQTNKSTLYLSIRQSNTTIPTLQWIHPPKTGSSWLNAMYYTCCGKVTHTWEPNRNLTKSCKHCDVSTFQSGHKGINATRGDVIASMFRKPAQRIKSGFFHDLHDCPPMISEFCERNEKRTAVKSCDYTRILRDVTDTFVRYWRCVEGCTVKMFTSPKECWEQPYRQPTHEEVTRAISVVKSPRTFVGLTEKFDESAALFHRMFAGDGPPLKEVPLLRAMSDEKKRWLTDLDRVIRLKSLIDRADTYLYNAAAKVHRKRLRLYGIYGI